MVSGVQCGARDGDEFREVRGALHVGGDAGIENQRGGVLSEGVRRVAADAGVGRAGDGHQCGDDYLLERHAGVDGVSGDEGCRGGVPQCGGVVGEGGGGLCGVGEHEHVFRAGVHDPAQGDGYAYPGHGGHAGGLLPSDTDGGDPGGVELAGALGVRVQEDDTPVLVPGAHGDVPPPGEYAGAVRGVAGGGAGRVAGRRGA